jgi:hypothetical protein
MSGVKILFCVNILFCDGGLGKFIKRQLIDGLDSEDVELSKKDDIVKSSSGGRLLKLQYL